MVLHVCTEFGKGLAAFAFRGEHWVIAKTFCAALLGSYLTTYDAFEEVFFTILNKGYDRAKLCRAVCLAVKFGQELLGIGFGVVTIGVGIAGCVYTRTTASS